MPPAGIEVLARWREAGEWWMNEPPREWVRYLDERGIRREKSQEMRALDLPDHLIRYEKDDWRDPYGGGRLRKVRDEKMRRFNGLVLDPQFSAQAPETPAAALLHVVSGYSFGRSTLLAEETPDDIAERGYSAGLIADRFSVAGAWEFSKTSAKVGMKALIGATVELEDGSEIVLVARTRRGYVSLSRLITRCHLDQPRGYPLASWGLLEQFAEDLLVLTGGDAGPVNRAVVHRDYDAAYAALDRFIALYGRENVFVEIERTFLPWERMVNCRLLEMAERMRVTPVAGGAVTHLEAAGFPAQDVLVCVESLCVIDDLEGRKPRRAPEQASANFPPRRALNAERYLRSVGELEVLYADRPDLIENTLRLADRCDKKILPELTQFPKLGDDEGGMLREAVWKGAAKRYRSGMSPDLKARIEFELHRITDQGFSAHFLIAADMCAWARSQGILFSGRGSVVDSVVAFCLDMARIDAHEHDLYFDRFLPADVSKRPDIDIDFEASRREDVRQYLVGKYGQDHVATVAAFGAYRTRGIIRDVGKVLGIPPESITYLSKRLHGSVTPERLREAIEHKPELRDSGIPVERFEWVFKLAKLLVDVPMGIRAHSSGVIVTREPVCDTVPVMLSADEDVRIIQWDKRTAKNYFDKFDVLCLRGNDVLSGAQSRIRLVDCEFDVEQISLTDDETYNTMRQGQLIGIPQSASPAMRQAHVRLQTSNLKEASLVQAGIRPGVGGAVKLNELIARHRYKKKWELPHPDLYKILEDTYGLIVFQEQVDMLLQTFGGYTASEAETIREDIYKKRREEFVEGLKRQVVDRIRDRGHNEEVAAYVYDLVSLFQGYGFAEGHALAFAEVSVRSVWCQQNYPSEYFAALLDSQPAGYYGPATIANEARTRGVKVLHPDANRSELTFLTEDVVSDDDPKLVFPNAAIRVSLKQISGVSKATLLRILECRRTEYFRSFYDFVARVRPARDELERLILSGTFDSLAPNRRALLWAIPRAQQYADLHRRDEDALTISFNEPDLPDDIEDFNVVERAIHERDVLDLDVQQHLVAFERDRVREKGGVTAAEAGKLPAGTKAFVVGNPIRLRFPPTSSGKRVMFFDLEDESGLLNVTVFDDVYQRYGHAIICSGYVTLFGEAQDRDGHIAFLAHRVYRYNPRLGGHGEKIDIEALPLVTADFLVS